MSEFAVNIYPHLATHPGDGLLEPRSAITAPSAELTFAQNVQRLMVQFRSLLLSGPSSGHFDLRGSDARALTLAWLPAGHTAGSLFFVRRYTIEAAVVFAAGLDKADDAQALFVASSVIHDYPRPAGLAGHEGPLYAAAYTSAASARDPLIAAATAAWSAVFFGMLGLSSDRTATAPQ